MRGASQSSVEETVNAAAAAIASAESRIQPVEVERRKWATWFSVYWCFGTQKNGKRISHAVLVPEPVSQRPDPATVENRTQPPAVMLPFIAPPSSPVSFLQSEGASVVQSPVGPPSFSPLSPHSPPAVGHPSMFVAGPYAHETQLVSPPVFSAFTTEPSTAPLTPPPESVHMTTPSSPEVPYAKLLTSIASSKHGNSVELQSYQLYPESPIGRLISPSSACSGTSSPFPDPDSHSSGQSSVQPFPWRQTPRITDADGFSMQRLIPRHVRNGGSILDGHITAAVPVVDFSARPQNGEHLVDHRVSFELTVEDVTRCLEKKSASSGEQQQLQPSDVKPGVCIDETYHDLPEKARRSLSLRLAKEFKFENIDSANKEPSFRADWWANEKVEGLSVEPRKSWSFHPTT